MSNDDNHLMKLICRAFGYKIVKLDEVYPSEAVWTSKDDILRSLEQMSNKMKNPNPSKD